MVTTINIKDLRLKARIGVDENERRKPQELLANITLQLADSKAADSDDLADTVDYSALEKRMSAEVAATSFHLLEKLAAVVLAMLMSDPRVQAASVQIEKRSALEHAESVSVICASTKER